MAHCRLLFVGGMENLDKIFENCPDSSSESTAEITIGADWIADYRWLSEEERKKGWTTNNFTKADIELYQQVVEGLWYECFDIRNPKHYGNFACLNCSDYETYNSADWREREIRNKKKTIEAIKNLPDDTLFHFADSHW